MVRNSPAGCYLIVSFVVFVFLSAPSSVDASSSDISFVTGQWSTPHIYNLDSERSAWRPALVIDSQGTPHGVFIDIWATDSATGTWLSYLTGSGGEWIGGTIEGTEHVSSFSIAIDESDRLHMCAAVPGELRYFTNYELDSSYVVVEEVSADSCKIIVDAAGMVHVLYLDTTLSVMKHATLLDEAWSIESVDDVSMMNSVALGPDGAVYGCYYSDESPLVFFSNSSGDWEFETVDSQCDVQWWSATVALLSDGKPILSYCDQLNQNLKLAFLGFDGDWSVSVLAADAGFASMAVDKFDNAMFSYLSGGSVYYMMYSGGARMWLAVNSLSQIGSPTAIAADSEGYAHILYRYVYQFPGSQVSMDSDDLVYATNALDVPRGPSGLTISQERGGLRLSWTADSGSYSTGVDGYRIYRGVYEGAQSYLATVYAPELAYLDESAEPSTDYYYRVTAFNDDGESLYEQAATVDTVGWNWENGLSLSDYALVASSVVIAVLVILLLYQRGRYKRKSEEAQNLRQGPKGP